MRSHYSRSLFVLLFLTACGGDDDKAPPGDPINSPAATSSALSAMEATANLTSLSTDNADDQSALGGVGGLFGSYYTVLNAKYAEQQQKANLVQSKLTDDAANSFNLPDLATADFSDCYTVSGDTITYSDCESEGFTLDGTLTVTETSLSIDITMEGTEEGMTMSMTMQGALSFSDTALTGDLSLDVEGTTNGQNVTFNIDAEYDVVLTDGCATGGTMVVDGSWSYGQSNADVTAYIEFGPTCGEAVVR